MFKRLAFILTGLAIPLFSQDPSFSQEQNPIKTETQVHDSLTVPSFPDDLHKPVEGRDFMWEFVNMLITLGFVIVLLLALMWFLRRIVNNRLNQMNTTSQVKILETRALSSKTVIYLLEIQGTGIAIAESHNGITRLSQFDLRDFEPKPPSS